jgi:hypothetical protein
MIHESLKSVNRKNFLILRRAYRFGVNNDSTGMTFREAFDELPPIYFFSLKTSKSRQNEMFDRKPVL